MRIRHFLERASSANQRNLRRISGRGSYALPLLRYQRDPFVRKHAGLFREGSLLHGRGRVSSLLHATWHTSVKSSFRDADTPACCRESSSVSPHPHNKAVNCEQHGQTFGGTAAHAVEIEHGGYARRSGSPCQVLLAPDRPANAGIWVALPWRSITGLGNWPRFGAFPTTP